MNSQEVDWLLTEKYQGEKSLAFFADVAALEAGTPLAYLIGHIPFLGTTIYLDSHPLIPRPETEFWVEKAIQVIKFWDKTPHTNSTPSLLRRPSQTHPPLVAHSLSQCEGVSRAKKILDLCAGSGAVGVAVAKHLPDSTITFIELDSHHLPTIARNCRENGIKASRVNILAGDLFVTNQPLPRFDFILSNPPYIDATLGRTEDSVILHEPELALWGGKAGMEIIARIIKDSTQHLNPNGQIWLEHEPEQIEAIKALAKNRFDCYHHLDQYQVPRLTQLVLK